MSSSGRGLAAGTVVVISLLGATSAATAGNVSEEAALRRYVQSLPKPDDLPPPPAEIDWKDGYQVAWVDLNGDGRRDAIIRWTGFHNCGSGGCGMEVLERTRTGFKSRGAMTITQLPVEVLPTRHHGWRDISVLVAGGGILPGYRSRLEFNGRLYPRNPSVPPARRLSKTLHGTVLIDTSTPVRDDP